MRHLMRIRQAYYPAEQAQRANQKTLSIRVREAIIHVYHEGGRDTLSEAKGSYAR